MKARRHVRVGADELAAVGASPVLALALGVGGGVRLAAEEPATFGEVGDAVVVQIMGPLAQRAVEGLCAYVDGYDAVEARFALALEAAAERDSGVVMIIDSPGGDVAGLEEALRRMAEAKAATGRRVVAYVDELAASAAYWIAAGLADEIVAPASALVGSIGCIGAVVDLSEQEKANGVRWTVVRDPAGKAESMPYAPIAVLVEERLEERVRSAGRRFTRGVAQARAISAQDIRALNGALLSAEDGKARGLIDHVGGLTSAIERSKSRAPSPREKRRMEHAALAQALGLDASAGVDEIMTAARAAVADRAALEAQVEAFKAKAAEADDLRAQLAAIEAQRAEAELEAIVDGAAKAGKLPPARRAATLEAARKHGAEWARALVDALPVVVGAAPPVAPAPTGASAEGLDEFGLTARQRAIAAEHKIDPRAYAAGLAKMNAPGGR